MLGLLFYRYAEVNIVAKGDNNSIPDPSNWKLSDDAAYVSYCDNETIQGVEFKSAPEVRSNLVLSSNGTPSLFKALLSHAAKL